MQCALFWFAISVGTLVIGSIVQKYSFIWQFASLSALISALMTLTKINFKAQLGCFILTVIFITIMRKLYFRLKQHQRYRLIHCEGYITNVTDNALIAKINHHQYIVNANHPLKINSNIKVVKVTKEQIIVRPYRKKRRKGCKKTEI